MNTFIKLSLVLSIMISSFSFAQRTAVNGELISANQVNSSSSQIGEIKQSILDVSEFQQLHGKCWVRMEGQSIEGSDLAILKPSFSSLPNLVNNGEFLRQAKPGRVVGTLESDELRSHSHTSLIASDRNGNPDGGSDSGGGRAYWRFATTQYPTSATGGDETRPKNLAINFFIKINKNCLFN